MIELLAQDASPSAEAWLNAARESAFPYDGARYEGGDVHDPSLAWFKDRYIMVTTSGHELAPVSVSKNLVSWERRGPIMPVQPDWLVKAIPGHRSVWAPDPLVLGDRLRMYYCASEKFGSNTSSIAWAECEKFDPEHPSRGWVDKGVLISSRAGESNFNAIDPDVLAGPDGRHWMVYGSYWSGIYQVELDPATGGLLHPEKPPLHVASSSEKGNPLEAPALFHHDGWYFLGVTYGLAAQGIRSTYRMVVGRSRNPDGPFLGFDGKPMTEGGHADLLKSSSPMFGPGGGNYFTDRQGSLCMAYHYYDSRRFWVRDMWGLPTLQIRRLAWGPDGWPLPGLPEGIELGPKQESPVGKWLIQADFGRVDELTLSRDGQSQLGPSHGAWDQEGRILRLNWPREDAPGGRWVDTLTLDASGQYAVGRNQSGTVIRAIKRDAKAARKL